MIRTTLDELWSPCESTDVRHPQVVSVQSDDVPAGHSQQLVTTGEHNPSLEAPVGMEDTLLARWLPAYRKRPRRIEVDFVLGDMEVAVEAKSRSTITSDHLKGLRNLVEDHPVGRRIVVCREPKVRTPPDGIEVLPVGAFVHARHDARARHETEGAGKRRRVPVAFLGRHEFIRNKLASGRPKNLADVEALGGAK